MYITEQHYTASVGYQRRMADRRHRQHKAAAYLAACAVVGLVGVWAAGDLVYTTVQVVAIHLRWI